jgi:hypothetical protein
VGEVATTLCPLLSMPDWDSGALIFSSLPFSIRPVGLLSSRAFGLVHRGQALSCEEGSIFSSGRFSTGGQSHMQLETLPDVSYAQSDVPHGRRAVEY